MRSIRNTRWGILCCAICSTNAARLSKTQRIRQARQWAAGRGRAMRSISIMTAFSISTLPTEWSPALGALKLRALMPRRKISTVSSGGRWWRVLPTKPARLTNTSKAGTRSMNSSVPMGHGVVTNGMFFTPITGTELSPTSPPRSAWIFWKMGGHLRSPTSIAMAASKCS